MQNLAAGMHGQKRINMLWGCITYNGVEILIPANRNVMREKLIAEVIGIWVSLPFSYIHSLYDSMLEKNCNC